MKQISTDRYEYWAALYGKHEMAAITCVSIGAVQYWSAQDTVPEYALKMMKLYTGMLTMADWEDEVTEAAHNILMEGRRKTQARKEVKG